MLLIHRLQKKFNRQHETGSCILNLKFNISFRPLPFNSLFLIELKFCGICETLISHKLYFYVLNSNLK